MSREQQEIRRRMIEKLVERMKKPIFQGRQDWLKKWNPKACRFEVVDVEPIMLMMAFRRFAPKGHR